MPSRLWFFAALLTAFLTTFIQAADPPTVLDPARVAEIAPMLPEQPEAIGASIDNRAVWDRLAGDAQFARIIDTAENLLDAPIPPLTDELFLDYSKTGNRTRCQRVLSVRHGRVPTLVMAECLENKGRFLPALEASIRAVCSEKTWVMPAHDGSLRNFRGETNEIDLAVAAVSWDMALARAWLGDRLSADVRTLIAEELERRTFSSYESYIERGEPRLWWARGTNNWNAVCVAGTVGAALATIESRERRARFIAAGEIHIGNFRRGFTPDGYCSEGIGYWNYGFGNYVKLAETLRHATGGKVDLYAHPKTPAMSWFGYQMEITDGVYPALADCSPGSRPSTGILGMVSRRLDLGLDDAESEGLGIAHGPSSSLYDNAVFVLPFVLEERTSSNDTTVDLELRSWFPDAGVLICRPADGMPGPSMGVAMKAGHNAEHHNHNDVGTYLIALAGQSPLVDPGAEVYTARTFSSRRYDSDVLNSLGHPVPRIDGKLQRSGSAARGVVLRKEFSDAEDVLEIDLAAAYTVEGLQSMRRTFCYQRKERGRLTITDQIKTDRPVTFETALVTFARIEKLDDGKLLIGDEGSRVLVEIDTAGAAYALTTVELTADVRASRQPWRIGIVLSEPTSEATVIVRVKPET